MSIDARRRNLTRLDCRDPAVREKRIAEDKRAGVYRDPLVDPQPGDCVQHGTHRHIVLERGKLAYHEGDWVTFECASPSVPDVATVDFCHVTTWKKYADRRGGEVTNHADYDPPRKPK